MLCPKRLLSFPKKIKLVASGPTACHSVCIDVDGGVRRVYHDAIVPLVHEEYVVFCVRLCTPCHIDVLDGGIAAAGQPNEIVFVYGPER